MTVVVLDTTVLLLLLDTNAHPPTDLGTGKPLQWCRERMECLLDHFEKTKTVALIPAPVLCEVLVGVRDPDAFVREIRKAPVFDIADFDAASAIAAAEFIRARLSSGSVAVGGKTRAKFDAQILGIAKVRNAKTIYTDDKGLASQATANGITAISTADIPLPPQSSLI